MGSFSFTCAFSGLTITCGDRVKFFLLTQNPYNDSRGCQAHDFFFPRSWPLTATYNDYGSIENYDENSLAVLSIIEGLKEDLVEFGFGDNSCHDVPTTKGMNFSTTLNAIQEGRVLVKRDTGDDELADEMYGDDELADDMYGDSQPWLPRLRTVIKILQEAGHVVNSGRYADPMTFLVDEKNNGWVRIRSGEFGDKELPRLEKIIPLLEERFAVLLTAGSGAYSNTAELQIMPKPGPFAEHRGFLKDRKETPLRVYQAMILQEVWDEFKAIFVGGRYKVIRDHLQKEWDEAVGYHSPEATTDETDPELRDILRQHRQLIDDNIFIGRGLVPFTVGLPEHFNLAAKIQAENPLPEEKVQKFLDDVAAFVGIQEKIYMIRYMWRPSYSCGPQFGEFKQEIKWGEMITRVATKMEKKHRCWEDE